MGIIRRLQDVKTWSELMGIQSAVFEAASREELAAKQTLEEFMTWKDNLEKSK